MASRAQGELFSVPSSRSKGPIYQGVCKQIRSVVTDREDRKRLAGTIAAARSLADVLDQASGHSGRRPASGMQLAAMHDQLQKYLDVIAGEDQADDAFDTWIKGLGKTDDSDTAPSHAEV